MAEKGYSDFRLTYATMYDPPEELHESYEAALEEVRSSLGAEHAMIIDGQDAHSVQKFEDRSPINQEWVLGSFQSGTGEDAHRALEAAQRAVPSWARMPWKERVETMRRAAAQIDSRVYEIAAILSLEVGKNRMEALADAAEAADLIRYSCDQMESNRRVCGSDGCGSAQGLPGTEHLGASALRCVGGHQPL